MERTYCNRNQSDTKFKILLLKLCQLKMWQNSNCGRTQAVPYIKLWQNKNYGKTKIKKNKKNGRIDNLPKL